MLLLIKSYISLQGMTSDIMSAINSRHLTKASSVSTSNEFFSLDYIKFTIEKSLSTEAVPNGKMLKYLSYTKSI